MIPLYKKLFILPFEKLILEAKLNQDLLKLFSFEQAKKCPSFFSIYFFKNNRRNTLNINYSVSTTFTLASAKLDLFPPHGTRIFAT
jgi:hypothetical protein